MANDSNYHVRIPDEVDADELTAMLANAGYDRATVRAASPQTSEGYVYTEATLAQIWSEETGGESGTNTEWNDLTDEQKAEFRAMLTHFLEESRREGFDPLPGIRQAAVFKGVDVRAELE